MAENTKKVICNQVIFCMISACDHKIPHEAYNELRYPHEKKVLCDDPIHHPQCIFSGVYDEKIEGRVCIPIEEE